MPLTADQIENAEPGLRLLKPDGENERLSTQVRGETNSKPSQKPKLAANDQAPQFG